MGVPEQVDIAAIMEKPIEKLTESELKIRVTQYEQQLKKFQIATDLNDWTHANPKQIVEFDVPPYPGGGPNTFFQVNTQSFPPGRHKATLKCALTLRSMVSEAYKVEGDKIRSRGRGDLFKEANVSVNNLMQIRRFEEIMDNGD